MARGREEKEKQLPWKWIAHDFFWHVCVSLSVWLFAFQTLFSFFYLICLFVYYPVPPFLLLHFWKMMHFLFGRTNRQTNKCRRSRRLRRLSYRNAMGLIDRKAAQKEIKIKTYSVTYGKRGEKEKYGLIIQFSAVFSWPCIPVLFASCSLVQICCKQAKYIDKKTLKESFLVHSCALADINWVSKL